MSGKFYSCEIPNKGDWSGHYSAPVWEEAKQVHEWRNYINDEVRAIWDTFTDEQKRALARNAEELASKEEWD